MNKDNSFTIVGIGASAGGYEALHEFVENLDSTTNVAYVITQHLDPSQPTMLLELLSKFSILPMSMIENNMILYPKHIYICPPNNNLTIIEGKCRLTSPEQRAFPKPSINIFFTSLAKAVEEKAVGIIFSGTGSDGADGIKAIKNAGGIAIAQDERTAKYASMPRAAIDTGCVDVVLSPEDIAKELSQIIKAPNILNETHIISQGIDRIFDILVEKYQVDFTDYKLGTIQRRLERRMVVNKVTTIEDYLKILSNSDHEVELLYKDLLVIVTSFFRNSYAFEDLEKLLGKLVYNSQDNDIRVWIPGCATGEEAYSIAMILREEVRKQNKRKRIQIFATDISDDAISKARNAIFTKEELEHIKHEYISSYFITSGDYFEIKKDLRDSVIFSKHDIIKDPAFLKLDLISCRNLLIYFNNSLQKRIMSIFHNSLKSNGLLFLGKSESITNLSDLFITINSRSKIFKKDSTAKNPTLDSLTYYPKRYINRINTIDTSINNPIVKLKQNTQINKETILIDSITQSLKNSLIDDYIIIDRNNSISHTHGKKIGNYITFPKGSLSNDIFAWIDENFRLDLRVLISKARKQAVSFNQKVKFKDKNTDLIKFINVIALPLEDNNILTSAIAIVFIESSDKIDISNIQDNDSSYAKELETELLLTKEQLQTTIEELETSNEELQSTNEELQSTNEELQSTNEELETSNEELQSTNEELTTVNDELEIKSHDLKATNDDLNNVFNTMEYGVIFLDKDLKIKRYTTFIEKIFKISRAEIGSIITSVPCNIDFPNLREDIENVIKSGKVKDIEFNNKGIRYFCQLKPYINEYNYVSGVTLVFQDKTEIYKSEDELKRYKNELEALVEEKSKEVMTSDAQLEILFKNVGVGILLIDEKGNIKKVNQAVCDILGYKEDILLQSNMSMFTDDVSYKEGLKNLSIIQRENVKFIGNGDTKIWINSSISKYIDETTKETFYIKTIEDITEKREQENKLQELNKNLEQEVEKKLNEVREKEQLLIQQSKLASMGEMIGSIAHQWRQPLNSLSIQKEYILDCYFEGDLTDEDMEKYDHNVDDLLQYMSKTIDDFRNFFRPSKEKEDFNLVESIKNILNILEAQLKQHMITLNINNHTEENLSYFGYPNEFKQVIINIVNNAKDAIINKKLKDGQIDVNINSDENHITIEISDNAGGVPQDIINRIFEPYFTTKFESQGTGLGLYMSKTIIEKNMNGKMSVNNNDKGAVFVIKLKIQK
jgi:two-component system CheB/CheR fusion protein